VTQGIAQKFTDAAWRSANIVIPPLPVLSVPTTLWAYLGTSLAASQNMVAGAPPIIEVGTPEYPTLPIGNVIRAGPTTSSLPYGKGYLDTQVPDESKSFTLVFAARENGIGAGAAVPLACGKVGNAGGTIRVLLGFAAGGGGGLQCAIVGPNLAPVLPVANYYRLKTYLITYDDPTFTMSIYDLTDGTSITATGSSFTRSQSTNSSFTVGLMPVNTVGTGSASDVAMVGKISGSVNATQAAQIGANVRATLALTGLMA